MFKVQLAQIDRHCVSAATTHNICSEEGEDKPDLSLTFAYAPGSRYGLTAASIKIRMYKVGYI